MPDYTYDLDDLNRAAEELRQEIEDATCDETKQELQNQLVGIEKMIAVETRLALEEREDAYRAYGVSWAI